MARRRMSQRMLALHSGLNHATISRLLTGSRDPSLSTVLALIRALEGPVVEVRSLHPAVHLPVALVWRRDTNLSPAARACIEFVRGEVAR